MDTRIRTLRRVRSSIVTVTLACLLCFVSVQAQTRSQVEVTGNVNLRPSPSTVERRIVLLHPPVRLDLLETTPTDGYFHVRAQNGEEGWVWSRRVRQIQSSPATANLPPPQPPPPSPSPAPPPP